MSLLSIPTPSALSPAQLLSPSHPSVTRTLQRLSRPALLALALDWLSDQNQESELTTPYLIDSQSEDEDEQDLYPSLHSLSELRELYTELQSRKGSKRDVVDRILEGDWRNGISLYQLAMADMQYLYDHPTSQKWSALKIVRLESAGQLEKATSHVPRFQPALFLRNLQREVLPDVKAHYNLDRYEKLGLMVLRVFIVDSPYNTSLALQSNTGKRAMAFDASRTFYVAFPDAAPYIYVSLTTTVSTTPGASISDNRSLRKLVLDGIPKAFSKPRERYSLESTNLSARNLEALVEKRGGNRGNAAGAGWSVYAGENKKDTPLNIHLPTPESINESDAEKEFDKVSGLKRRLQDDEKLVKRRKLLAAGRFEGSAKHDDGKGIERFEVMIRDPFPSSILEDVNQDKFLVPPDEIHNGKKRKGRRSTLDMELNRQDDDIDVETEGWRPNIRVVFQGKHVFAGIRQLMEEGLVDGEEMPGWMTGEESVSVGMVQNGRIKGFKGSGT